MVVLLLGRGGRHNTGFTGRLNSGFGGRHNTGFSGRFERILQPPDITQYNE